MAAVESEQVGVIDPTDIRNAPPPPYVVTQADRERWKLAGMIAEAIWEANAPDERLDPQFYWTMQRAAYSSDMPTGSPDDAALTESGETGPEVEPEKLWAEVEKQKPGRGAKEEDYWAHIGRICDVFDKVFGNPDDFHLGEYEGALAPAAPEDRAKVEEFGVAMPHIPYNAGLHPRDRLGKWSQKLGGIHAAAMDRKGEIEHRVGAAVAANRLGHEVHARPLHNPAADEERAREGLHGAVQRLRAGTTRTHNAAVANLGLALMKAEEIEHEHPRPQQNPVQHVVHRTLHTAIPAHQAPAEQMAGAESVERSMHLSDVATEAGRWAMEHEHEIRLVGHALSQAGRAFGLTGADVAVEDEQEARAILESLTS